MSLKTAKKQAFVARVLNEKAVAERQPLYRFYKSFFLCSRILDVCLCCFFFAIRDLPVSLAFRLFFRHKQFTSNTKSGHPMATAFSLFRLRQTKSVSRILDVCLCCLFCDTGYARVARLSALLSPQAIPHSIRKKRPPNGNRFFHCFVCVKPN